MAEVYSYLFLIKGRFLCWLGFSRYVLPPVGQGPEKGLEPSSALGEKLQKKDDDDDDFVFSSLYSPSVCRFSLSRGTDGDLTSDPLRGHIQTGGEGFPGSCSPLAAAGWVLSCSLVSPPFAAAGIVPQVSREPLTLPGLWVWVQAEQPQGHLQVVPELRSPEGHQSSGFNIQQSHPGSPSTLCSPVLLFPGLAPALLHSH